MNTFSQVISIIIGYGLVIYSLITGNFPTRGGSINADSLPELYWSAIITFFVISTYLLWKFISKDRH
ncbi:hypothetical protein [Desulfamplus magnetovallimortis]|uniref:hypothetical protein n=1 Tax=Desulfamplus magnetovallimortis TaxID=1246637 RepID=UPI00111B4889|nr:hypothetical protein [Desulfamplus magnetovallimortis]